MAMLKLLQRMGRADLTVHGFRSTFRDWAAERTEFPDEVVEMALAHAIDSKTEAAYRRGDLFEKRRDLMDAWAEFCRQQAIPGSVIPLNMNDPVPVRSDPQPTNLGVRSSNSLGRAIINNSLAGKSFAAGASVATI